MRDQRGASAVEYALLVVLCAAVFALAAYALQSVGEAVFRDSACDDAQGYECTETP
jgi:Flp pilus assembly pilin Flp